MNRRTTSLTGLSLALFIAACGTDDKDMNEPIVPAAPTDGVSPVATLNPVTPNVSPTGSPTVNPGISPVDPTSVSPVTPQVAPTTVSPSVPPVDPAPVNPDVNPSDTDNSVTPVSPVAPDPVPSDSAPTVAPSGTDDPTEPMPDAGGVPVDETPIVRPGLVTSGPNAYWQEGELTEMNGGNADVTVNENDAKQEWLGFGGTFNEKGWEALEVLDAAERDRAIRLLFDKREGAGFDWGRIPMGSPVRWCATC